MTCHSEHEHKVVDIHLGGVPKGLPDAPAMPALDFKLTIFDWQKYENTEGLCPGDDIVSKSIDQQGIWEAFETRLFLDLLDGGKVVDIGSQLGWFSIIAALKGCPVQAYDTLDDNIIILGANAMLNKIDGSVTNLWIDQHSPILPAEDITVFKCDIEGNEQWAVRMYEESFKAKRIKYAMLEISPCFNDSYPELVKRIEGYGYKAYQIPGKLYVHHRIDFGRDPLKTMLEHPVVIDWKTMRQENFLFVRQP